MQKPRRLLKNGLAPLRSDLKGRLHIKCRNLTRFGVACLTRIYVALSREDALNSLYERFAQVEGLDTVVHCGNMVDGNIARINGGHLKRTTIDGQTNYVIDRYPIRSGIRTVFITGDDHEGWWQKEGFNFGKHLELESIDQGRSDLVYS